MIEPAITNKKLFCFGYGYTAQFLSERLKKQGWSVYGTTTDIEKCHYLKRSGLENAFLFDSTHPIADPHAAFHDVTHILVSIPPDTGGDTVVNLHGRDIAREMPNLEWIGYLSATAVYGNHDGNWITEETPLAPSSRRGTLRERAESDWTQLAKTHHLPLHIFRLSGIYGPGRSAIDSVRAGLAKRIDKPGHVFNRIHIDDIVQVLIASINAPKPGSIYNLADDLPSASHEVISYACELTGTPPPPLTPFDQAELAPIVRSFYKDNKRIRNDKIKNELGIKFLYPDYHSGLRACFEAEGKAFSFLKLGKTETSSG